MLLGIGFVDRWIPVSASYAPPQATAPVVLQRHSNGVYFSGVIKQVLFSSGTYHQSPSISPLRSLCPVSVLQACAKQDNLCLEGQSSAAYLLKRWDEDDNGTLSYKELEK